MRRRLEHHPAVYELGAADEPFGAQLEMLAEPGLIGHVQVEMDAVQRATPLPAGEMARLAHLVDLSFEVVADTPLA